MTTSTSYAIGIDVGTGSVRCMIFDDKWTPVVQCQKAIRVRWPRWLCLWIACFDRSYSLILTLVFDHSVSWLFAIRKDCALSFLDISFIISSTRIWTIIGRHLASNLLLCSQMSGRKSIYIRANRTHSFNWLRCNMFACCCWWKVSTG